MIIGAVNKFSLLDFPGEIACIVFTSGCNLRCFYCYNSEFVLSEKIETISKSFIPKKIFFNFLKTRKGLLTGVSICGGEPTLQKDLYDFCKEVKNMGFKVKLDTNGVNPKMLRKLVDNDLVDYIAMDIKNIPGEFYKITQIKEDEQKYYDSISILLNSNINYEFRTTVIKGLHTLDSLSEIYKLISGAKNFFIQNFRVGEILDKDFVGQSFTLLELEEFKTIGGKFVENIGIR